MSRDIITERIKKIKEYAPNTEPCRIRLDANESPMALDEDLYREFTRRMASLEFNRYPDPFAVELIDEFAAGYALKRENVVAGNGSDELISLICSGFIDSGDTVVITDPDFSMYEFYSRFSGGNVVKYPKQNGRMIDLDDLSTVVQQHRAKMVILSNPCNPTGVMLGAGELLNFIRRTDALIIIDEAYMEFARNDQSLLRYVEEFDHLIVLKTLSKAYASAAFRIGFAVSNRELTCAIRKIKSPYNLNSVSQLFGKIILENCERVAKNIAVIKENTQYLYQKICAIQSPSIREVVEPDTNFVYVQLDSGETVKRVNAYLMSNSIAIRCFTDAACLRITAGTKPEIDETILRIREVLA